MSLLSLKGVTKRFDATVALDGIHLEIGKGEFFCLLGPSGCGKTTLISIVAGQLPGVGIDREGRESRSHGCSEKSRSVAADSGPIG